MRPYLFYYIKKKPVSLSSIQTGAAEHEKHITTLSGFALYLDRLMHLVKPEVIAGDVPQRIMIRASSGEAANMKEAFRIAASLREAGYITEFDLDGQLTDGLRWLIDVLGERPPFVLIDLIENEKFEVSTTDEFVELMESQGGDKDKSRGTGCNPLQTCYCKEEEGI